MCSSIVWEKVPKQGAKLGTLNKKLLDAIKAAGGSVVDTGAGSGKARELRLACERLEVPCARAIAIGDGANDLAMMREAGLSVAFHAKPVVRASARVAIHAGGLDTLLAYLD